MPRSAPAELAAQVNAELAKWETVLASISMRQT
jgi:hypothetical protein